MAQVKCVACGADRTIADKPAPKTAREMKQILFNCTACGAVNLRDGTAVASKHTGKWAGKTPQTAVQEPQKPTPQPPQPAAVVTDEEPKQTKERIPHHAPQEESDDCSPFFI